MRIYLHKEESFEAEAVEAQESATLGDLPAEFDEQLVFLREDEDEILAADVTLADASIKDRGHVFAGKKAKITVDVQFNGVTHSKDFSASVRVEKVFKWAVSKKAFGLDAADAAEHTLSVSETDEIPAGDVHVGSLPRDARGNVVLNLVPKHRYEG